MTDFEIYSLAQDVISTITRDLNNGIYRQLNGNLSVGWIEKPKKFNAWAESANPERETPDHKIVLFFELARLLYRDIEEFCDYAGSGLPHSALAPLFAGSETIPSLPKSFTKDECVKNMFIAGLTWIYWHEFGHVSQEHGLIREKFGSLALSSRVEECADHSTEEESVTKEPITGRDAALSHVTELAADFFATHFSLFELFRHFLYRENADELTEVDAETLNLSDLVRPDYDPHTLIDSIYLFVCGLSCIFYRFHGFRNLEMKSLPEGSHPHPIIRMEFHLPQIFEFLGHEANRKMMKHGMSQEQLAAFCMKAANTAAVFWIDQKAKIKGFPRDFLVVGLLNRPNMADYFNVIISTWDEVEPTIRAVRRLGSDLDLLRFTDAMRDYFSTSSSTSANK